MSVPDPADAWPLADRIDYAARAHVRELLAVHGLDYNALVYDVAKAAREAGEQARCQFAQGRLIRSLQETELSQGELERVLGLDQSMLSRYLRRTVVWSVERCDEVMATLGEGCEQLRPSTAAEHCEIYRIRLLAAVNVVRTGWLHKKGLDPDFANPAFLQVLDAGDLAGFISAHEAVGASHRNHATADAAQCAECVQEYTGFLTGNWGVFLPFQIAVGILEGPADPG